MHPDFFRTAAVLAHHGAVTSTHPGPVHAWLHQTLGLNQGAGTAVITVAFVLLLVGLVTTGLRKVFG